MLLNLLLAYFDSETCRDRDDGVVALLVVHRPSMN
jgi:hypothetical protein